MAAICNISDYSTSTKFLASTTLRTTLGTKNMTEILSEREAIRDEMMDMLDKGTDPWGVQVNPD